MPSVALRRGLEVVRRALLGGGADRGSGSAFQMADTSGRILARGSTSTPECEAAGCFLSLPAAPLLSLPVFFLPSASLYSVLKFQRALQTEVQILSAPLAHLSSLSSDYQRQLHFSFLYFLLFPVCRPPVCHPHLTFQLTPLLFRERKLRQPPYGYDHA